MQYYTSFYLKAFSDSLIHRLTKFGHSKYFFLKLALITTLLSLFFGFPPYDHFASYQNNWDYRENQIESPFTPHEVEDHSSHESNFIFRFSVPFVLGLLHLPVEASHVVHYLFLFLLFWWVSKLSYNILEDKVLTILITLCFGLVYVGQVLYTDIRANFDVVAYALLVLSMLSRNPLVILFCVLAAGFTDERGFIATGIAFLFHFIYRSSTDDWSLKGLLKLNKQLIAIICGWVLYFGIRFYLQNYHGLDVSTPKAGLNYFMGTANMWFFGIWSGLEGLWLPVLLCLIPLLKIRAHLIILMFLVTTSAVIGVSLAVADITRSMAYVFPIVFVALTILRQYESGNWLRYFFIAVLIICLFPTYYASGYKMIIMVKPLPFQLIRWFGL